MAMKPAVHREPVIGINSGEMSTRTTITAFIEGGVDTDSDFLVDILNEYAGRNVEIVINSL